jgi:hypothetical protein
MMKRNPNETAEKWANKLDCPPALRRLLVRAYIEGSHHQLGTEPTLVTQQVLRDYLATAHLSA